MTEVSSSNSVEHDDADLSLHNNFDDKRVSQDCPLCSQPSLQILINNALYHKYLEGHQIRLLTYIDNIMDNQVCPEAVLYKEMAVVDEEEQFMRRVYSLQEYEYKNKAIVEYYKFHKDYPKTHIKGLNGIMEKYYDRKKEFEYKKIKRILKEEQNISISTHKSSQIFSDIDENEKKSNYSNVLNDLTLNSQLFNEQTNQSLVWKNMCSKIERGLQNKPLSPINFKKKSIFDQPQQKEFAQTKNFVDYLKKQQQKKQREEKYKNFIRSNKQSKYNSIQQTQSKQYASGIPVNSNFSKKLSKRQKAKPLNSFKGPSAFYDGKMFYNPTLKANYGGNSKDQRTKEQSNTPSHDNFDFDYKVPETGFKKNKQVFTNFGPLSKRQEQGQVMRAEQYNLQNFKSKPNFRTTEEIYMNATQEMKLKKRTISYNSLANTNFSSKRSSVTNILALKQKDFEVRNRLISETGKLLKQKNGPIVQGSSKINNQKLSRLQRAKSTGNFRTSRSVPKFYQANQPIQSQNKAIHSSTKKISVPKEIIQSLKGKSFSASKLKLSQGKYTTQSRQRSGDAGNQQIIRGSNQKYANKEKRRDINLFIENGLKNRIEPKQLFYAHQSANAMNIEKLLNTKLMGKGPAQKGRQPKILI